MIWPALAVVVGIGGPLGVLLAMRGRLQQWRNTRYRPERCRQAGCRGRQVGMSVWCREHTDAIFARRYSPQRPTRRER